MNIQKNYICKGRLTCRGYAWKGIHISQGFNIYTIETLKLLNGTFYVKYITVIKEAKPILRVYTRETV